jgi:hypothetical protein
MRGLLAPGGLLTAFVLSLAVVACTSSPDTLRLVAGPIAANREIAELLTSTSQAVAGPIRMELLSATPGNEAALDALDNGMADLAIIENNASYYRPTLRTVLPLYASVLHVAVRSGKQPQTLRELLDGATVLAGPEDGPARRLLDLIPSLYGEIGIGFSYVDSLQDDPDVLFVFLPLSWSRANMLEGYELFDMGRAEDIGAGSLADTMSLLVPQLRPFVIPRGAYGEHTPTGILTVAVDTLLVSHRDLPAFTGYDLLETLHLMAPALAARRPDLRLDTQQFDVTRFTFPAHPGALAFRARNDPSFLNRLSGFVESLTAGLGALAAIALALFRYLRGLRKNRIDGLYEQALAIRASVRAGLDNAQRRAHAERLKQLEDDAFRLLIGEKLYADESFRILQTLISDVFQELESTERPETSTHESSPARS